MLTIEDALKLAPESRHAGTLNADFSVPKCYSFVDNYVVGRAIAISHKKPRYIPAQRITTVNYAAIQRAEAEWFAEKNVRNILRKVVTGYCWSKKSRVA
jgi:hypothetical protein